MNNRITDNLERSTFCYAKEGGEGLIDKDDCTCGKDKECQEYLDREKFNLYFEKMEYGDFKERSKIINEIKDEFKDSKWWEENVIE